MTQTKLTILDKKLHRRAVGQLGHPHVQVLLFPHLKVYAVIAVAKLADLQKQATTQ